MPPIPIPSNVSGTEELLDLVHHLVNPVRLTDNIVLLQVSLMKKPSLKRMNSHSPFLPISYQAMITRVSGVCRYEKKKKKRKSCREGGH